MSTHIGAEPGQIAPVVLLPGDPLRARWIAQTFLEAPECYSEVRGMYGYTGTWSGHRVSVQGSGMGQPSMAIYVNELLTEYDVSTIVRVGSCGALTEKLALRDLVLASGACTDSSMNRATASASAAMDTSPSSGGDSPKPGRSTAMTSRRAARSSMMGSHDRHPAPSPCTRSRGLPCPRRT